MTRQNALDRAVIANAHGLDYLVLDELHTYRGRQGADVAMLVRRVRDRLCPEKHPFASVRPPRWRQRATTPSAPRPLQPSHRACLATPISSDAVIGESLERATDPTLKPTTLGAALVAAVNDELPANLDDEALHRHPLAVWCELEIGLSDGQRLSRRQPRTLADAAKRLAEQTGCDEARCRSQLQAFLMLASRPAHERGGDGDRAFLAFKLHRFISGAGHVYATLRGSGQRRVTLDGQRFHPEDQEARLYSTFFCRNCGQEHHPVVLAKEGGADCVLPRDIDDTPLDDPDSAERPGYLMPEPENDAEFTSRASSTTSPRIGLKSIAAALRGCAATARPTCPSR